MTQALKKIIKKKKIKQITYLKWFAEAGTSD